MVEAKRGRSLVIARTRFSRFAELMKTVAICLSLLALFVAPALHADEAADAKKTLLEAHKDFNEALADNDVTAVIKRLPADWKLVNSGGMVLGRDQLEEVLKSGKLKFSSYTSSDLDVRIYGEAAVIIGRGNVQGSWEGQEFQGSDRFTDVYVRRDGKWACVSTHTSRIAE
jgi:ketosteroid isomerase-like protein